MRCTIAVLCMEGRAGVVESTGAPGIEPGAAWGARPWRISQPLCALDLCEMSMRVQVGDGCGDRACERVLGCLTPIPFACGRWAVGAACLSGWERPGSRRGTRVTSRMIGGFDASRATCPSARHVSHVRGDGSCARVLQSYRAHNTPSDAPRHSPEDCRDGWPRLRKSGRALVQ